MLVSSPFTPVAALASSLIAQIAILLATWLLATLIPRHEHDGRDLDMTNAEKTLQHLRTLWRHDVNLQTKLRGKKALMSATEAGFDARLVA